MNSLKEKQNEIANFLDMEEDAASDKLRQEIKEYTETKSEHEVATEIRMHFPQNNASGIDVIYEVLAENPQKWSNFFKEEYERAFEAAKKSDHAFETLSCLLSIELYSDALDQVKSRDAIIGILEKHLSHEKAVIRHQAIWYLGDWILEDNIDKYHHVVKKIIQKLQDKHWKVRYVARVTLISMAKLPKGFKLSWIDQLKAKFWNPFRMD
jgi:hypothetical protein